MVIPQIDFIKLNGVQKKAKTAVVAEDCQKCLQKCCRYIGIEMDEPEDADDFEQIRWMVAHKDVGIYVEDGAWHVEIQTSCEKLGADGLCQIYERRPKMCREHGMEMDAENLCEGFQNVYQTYDHYFSNIEEIDAFIPGYLEEIKKHYKLSYKLKLFLDSIKDFFKK